MTRVTFERFREEALESVVRVGETFTKADDDWAPVVQMESGSGELVIVGFDPRLFGSEEGKGRMITAITKLSQAHRARKLALIHSAWMAMVTTDREPRPGDATADPNRVEVVIVSLFDQEIVEAYVAPILRDGTNPPQLMDWQRLGRTGALGGAFVDPIQEALR